MKSRMLISLAVGACVLSTGCSNNYLANTPFNGPRAPQMAVHPDGRVLGALVVLNRNEIEAGDLALHKTANPRVREFANMMVNQHTKNLQETEQLASRTGIMIEEGPAARDLRHKGHHEITHLSHLNGVTFDRAYVNDMVKGHRAGLALVNRLIAQANDPIVRRHLEITRDVIAMHLQSAVALQQDLRH